MWASSYFVVVECVKGECFFFVERTITQTLYGYCVWIRARECVHILGGWKMPSGNSNKKKRFGDNFYFATHEAGDYIGDCFRTRNRRGRRRWSYMFLFSHRGGGDVFLRSAEVYILGECLYANVWMLERMQYYVREISQGVVLSSVLCYLINNIVFFCCSIYACKNSFHLIQFSERLFIHVICYKKY